MYICIQPGTGDRGKRTVAVVWSVWGCTERKGDKGLPNTEMQGIRICDHDQLRRGPHGYSKSKRIRPWQPSTPSVVQNQ